MKTAQLSTQQAIHAMRARTADFFKMEVSRRVSSTPARDSNPLRRSLKKQQDVDFYVGNEHMCTAMWQLMQRC